MRTSFGGLVVLLASVSALSCSDKDSTKCQQAIDGTRKSVAAADAALTTQWRARAYKYCADSAALGALDKEISDTQAAQASAKALETRRLTLNAGLLKTFVTWAGDNKIAPDHASVSPKCDGDEPDAGAPKAPSADPKASERFCTATRAAGSNVLTARYWEADKSIELFMTKAPAPASCADLGPNNLIRSWDVPAANGATVKRARCALSGALSGMQAVVSDAANAAVYIFSPSYLLKDPALKKIAGD